MKRIPKNPRKILEYIKLLEFLTLVGKSEKHDLLARIAYHIRKDWKSQKIETKLYLTLVKDLRQLWFN